MENRSEKADLTSVPASGTEVFLAFGSSKGDRTAFIRSAMDGLADGGFVLKRISPFYETDPVDCEEGTSRFLNGIISGYWKGSAEALLELCQHLERRAGRPEKHSSRQARELDLDIILFGSSIIRTEKLTVPHPRASQRAFVLVPLNDLAPDAVFPDSGKTVRELLAELPDKSGIVRRTDI